MTLPPGRAAEFQRFMDGIARRLLAEALERDALGGADSFPRGCDDRAPDRALDHAPPVGKGQARVINVDNKRTAG
jgi:hypothetical protein